MAPDLPDWDEYCTIAAGMKQAKIEKERHPQEMLYAGVARLNGNVTCSGKILHVGLRTEVILMPLVTGGPYFFPALHRYISKRPRQALLWRAFGAILSSFRDEPARYERRGAKRSAHALP